MPSEFIRTDTSEGVFSITIDRPARLNSLTPEMHWAMHEAFDAFAADDAAQVCVVTGTGRAFCAGSDLATFSTAASKPYPPSGYAGIVKRAGLNKPVIAEVNGLCLGGGFEFALACDAIVASNSALFGLPEPKVGLIAVAGGMHRLVRQIGLKQAMLPLLTGGNISAAQGYAMGFISELVPADELRTRTAAIAQAIIANAPVAVRLTKELAMWGLDQPTLAEALAGQAELPNWKRWVVSEDASEGTAAFAEKRKPVWKGC